MTQKDATHHEENLHNEAENVETMENAENMTSDSADEIAKLKEQLARAQADYQNLVMRNERDRADMVFYLTEKLMSGLLVQMDNLDRAVKIKEGVEGDAFVDGVRAVQNGLVKFLESHKILAFESIGQEVDPERHDVLSQMPGKEGIIIQEFEKGYEFDGKVLRHAKVIVGSGE